MNEPVLREEGKKILETILNLWPAIIRKRRKEKILRILSGLMAVEGVAEAGADLVSEAIKFVVPNSYDAVFIMMEDMQKFRKMTTETYEDIEAYKARPINVRRWDLVDGPKPAKTPEQMKVLAFCASPRKNGNTDLLVEEALKGVVSTGAQAEKIMLQRLKLKFCVGCRKCKDAGFEEMCIVKDDMTDIYPKIVDSDAIIIGFPIFTGRECAQLATFFDRWDCFVRAKHQDPRTWDKRGMVIGTWGFSTIDSYDDIVENVMILLKMHRIETVEALSACGFEGMLHGLDENRKGMIAQRPELLKKAFDAGVSLVGGS